MRNPIKSSMLPKFNSMFVLITDDKTFATGVWFEEGEVTNSTRWAKLEELLVMSANGGSLPVIFRPTVQLYSSRTENKFSPVAYVKGKILDRRIKTCIIKEQTIITLLSENLKLLNCFLLVLYECWCRLQHE